MRAYHMANMCSPLHVRHTIRYRLRLWYIIDVYNYASENPGTNSLSIGNNIDSWQTFDTVQGLSEDPSVSGISVESDPAGKIFLNFTKVSKHIQFSGLSVSRTGDYSCDGLYLRLHYDYQNQIPNDQITNELEFDLRLKLS